MRRTLGGSIKAASQDSTGGDITRSNLRPTWTPRGKKKTVGAQTSIHFWVVIGFVALLWFVA